MFVILICLFFWLIFFACVIICIYTFRLTHAYPLFLYPVRYKQENLQRIDAYGQPITATKKKLKVRKAKKIKITVNLYIGYEYEDVLHGFRANMRAILSVHGLCMCE